MKNWKTIGALLIIVLMVLTGGDIPGSGNGEGSVAIEKVFVQGGTFHMGSVDSEAGPDESPVHTMFFTASCP